MMVERIKNLWAQHRWLILAATLGILAAIVYGATRLVHADVPELRLLLMLAPTGEASAAYLDDLRRDTARERGRLGTVEAMS